MYTLLDVKKMILDAIGEDSSSPTYWDSSRDSEIEDWINDAFEEICVLTGHYKESIYIPLMNGKKHYKISPGKGGEFLYLDLVRVLPTDRTVKMTDPYKLSRESYRWMTETGTPREFFMIGLDTIRVVPYPQNDGETLECIGVVIPPNYNLDDEKIDLQDAFIRAVVAYASYLMFLSMRMKDKAGVQLAEFARILGLYNIKTSNLMESAVELQDVG